jgi:hypothetical protein
MPDTDCKTDNNLSWVAFSTIMSSSVFGGAPMMFSEHAHFR